MPALCDGEPRHNPPRLVKETQSGSYLDPANPAVRQYIADGVEELCQNYDLDGIHFDDYFYPTTSAAFDAAEYAAADTGLSLEDWRRDNVNALMALCHRRHRPVRRAAGGGPPGRPRPLLRRPIQRCRPVAGTGRLRGLSDAPALLGAGLYAKRRHRPQSGYAGGPVGGAAPGRGRGPLCGAGRLPHRRTGDGSTAGAAEWQSGHALADQLDALESLGIGGVGLYRYASLWENTGWPELAQAERQGLAARWVTDSPGY